MPDTQPSLGHYDDAMVLDTKRFGTIDVDEDSIISVPDGIPGFPSFVNFLVIEASSDQPFYWLQSVDDGELAFLAVVPWSYFPDYTLSLDDDDEIALDVSDPADLLVLNLVTVDKENESVTANLLGPLIVNQSNHVARQVVMSADLPVSAPLGV